MVTKDIADKLIECDRKIEVLKDLKKRHNNPDGFQMLIDIAEARKKEILNSKG